MEVFLINGAINLGAMLFGGAINAGLLKLHRNKTKKSFDELLQQLDQRQIERCSDKEENHEPDHVQHIETPSENGYRRPIRNSKFKQ